MNRLIVAVFTSSAVLGAFAACTERTLSCPDPIETTVGVSNRFTSVQVDPSTPDAEVVFDLTGYLQYDCDALHDEHEIESAAVYENDWTTLIKEFEMAFTDGVVDSGESTCESESSL